jgi:hypothetical protein
VAGWRERRGIDGLEVVLVNFSRCHLVEVGVGIRGLAGFIGMVGRRVLGTAVAAADDSKVVGRKCRVCGRAWYMEEEDDNEMMSGGMMWWRRSTLTPWSQFRLVRAS